MIGTHSQKKCDILHKIFCEVYHKFVTVKKKLLFFCSGLFTQFHALKLSEQFATNLDSRTGLVDGSK